MSTDNKAFWQRQCRLFDELAELDPDQQQQQLAELAESEPELASRLAGMLAADRGSGLLDSGLSSIAPELNEAMQSLPRAGKAGLIIGAFRLLEPIGEGGMGEVWLAQRAQADYDQRVVIKLLKPGLNTRGLTRRFVQERAILARLSHPNIVHVIDGGLSAEGQPWYAMDYVSGTSITEYAARHALTARQKIRLMLPVIEAVAYAHGQLVVHRDIKPANIMVDEQGHPHLLDFGIAKLIEDTDDPSLTRTGVRALSPAYAAPEQLAGEPITTATDVFALGLVLQELVTGERPERDPRTGECQSVLKGPGRKRAAELSGDLALILAMATRVEPERRYLSAEALATDLRAWLERRPVAARGDSLGYRMRSFIRRHPGSVSAATGAVLALVVGLSLALWQADLARQQKLLAIAEAERANEQAELAHRTARFMERLFQIADPSEARGNAVTARELLDKAVGDLDSELLDQPRVRARLLITIGLTYRSLGLYAQARSLLERVIAEHETNPALLPEEVAVAHAHLGALLRRFSDFDASESHHQQALAYRMAVYGEASRPVAESLGALANLMQEAGRHVQARENYQRTLDTVGAVDGIESRHYAIWLANLGLLEVRDGDYEAAYERLAQAVSIYRTVLDPDHPELAWSLSMLAMVSHNLGQADKALALNDEAITIQEHVLGPDHFDVIQSLDTRARLLSDMGQHDEAIRVMERALAGYQSAVGTENLYYAGTMNNYANALMHAGQVEQAVARGLESRELLDLLVGREHPQRIQMDYSLGIYLSAAGRTEEALAAFQEALSMHELHGGLLPQQLAEIDTHVASGPAP